MAVGGGRTGEGKIFRGIADGLLKDLYIYPPIRSPSLSKLHFTPDVTQLGHPVSPDQFWWHPGREASNLPLWPGKDLGEAFFPLTSSSLS